MFLMKSNEDLDVCLLSETIEIVMNCPFYSEVESVGDYCMSDAHFIKQGKTFVEEREILQVQVMSCIETDAPF